MRVNGPRSFVTASGAGINVSRRGSSRTAMSPSVERRILSNRVALSVTVLIVSVSLAFVGCSNTPTSPTPTVAGRWMGTIDSASDGPGTIAMDIATTGVDVTGTVRLSQDGLVNLPGTFTGRLARASLPTSLFFSVTYEYGEHCQGSFSGALNVTTDSMSGGYVGQNCVRVFAGSLVAVRSGG
jgi:hypothetical protein